MCLTNYCFSARININNTSISLPQVPMKLNKLLLITMLIIKNRVNNTMLRVQELHTIHLKLHYQSFHFHQYFYYILQLIYQLTFFTFTIFII